MNILIIHPDKDFHSWIKKKYPDSLYSFSSEDFNNFCLNNINRFNKVAAEIAVLNPTNLLYWCSPISSRNTYQSEFFLSWCYFEYAKTFHSTSVHKIYCNSSILKDWLVKEFPNSEIICNEKRVLKKNYFLRFLWASTGYFFKVFLLKLFFSAIGNKSENKKIITLVDNFIQGNEFQNGNFKDAYYGRLFDDFNITPVYLPYVLKPLDFVKNFKSLSIENQKKFIFKEVHVSVSDILKCYFSFFDFSLNRETPFRDFLEKEYYSTFSNSNIESLLYVYFFKNLSRKGYIVEKNLGWFENHNIDHMYEYGLSKYFPKTMRIGYTGSFCSLGLFCISPIQEEIDMGFAPQRHFIIGGKLTTGKAEVAENFRLSLYSNSYSLAQVKKNIVVTLPLMTKESFLIIDFVYSSKIYESEVVVFTTHPKSEHEKIEEYIKSLIPAGKFIFSKKSTSEELASAKVLIFNVTAAFLEALIRNIPVILIGSETKLNSDPLPLNYSSQFVKIIYQPRDLKQFVDKLSLLPQELKTNFIEEQLLPYDPTKSKRSEFLKLLLS